jgi:hypothetical protein
MGIFFTSDEPAMPAIHTSLMEALKTDPKSVVDFDKEAAQRTVKLNKSVAPKFNPGRFVIAVALGGVMLGLAMYTSNHSNMADISKTLMTCFTSYNGIIIGLLGGEAQKAHSG